ncbi:MAG: hypothetical protein MUF58_23115 [Arcicella sp.]|jgi:hypothetical protein|nr:hypothetical protein [Arcicella sp.]
MKNIACNLIYNNGDESIYVGFKKRCDIQNIIYNVELDSGRWCSQPECSCRKFYDKGFKGKVEDYPCNESSLFENWQWNPGNEFKTGEPFRIKFTGAGKVAILTTRFANCTEDERKIVGFLKIKALVDNQHQIIGLKKQSLRLTIDEAQELNFWNYHRNKKSSTPMWRQGRFRYLEDIQVAAILHDLKDVVQNETTQSMINGLLENDFTEYSTIRPTVIGSLGEESVKKILLKRKYGKGGESKEHKQLKEYIAKNPDKIGLNKNEVNALVEHKYISGDLVDILFAPTKGVGNTVVEIELDNVEPGIHQAIKYRALRCSQLGLTLTDKNVKATVVAWQFKQSEKNLCDKYGIDYFEIKL